MRVVSSLILLVIAAGASASALAGSYVFQANPTHPYYGYDGTSRRVDIPICPTATEQYVSARNAAAALNRRDPLPGNTTTNAGDLPTGSQIDFEETLLHEIGHAVGFPHLFNANHGWSNDINPGMDGIIGTEDDAVPGMPDHEPTWFPVGVGDNSPFIVPSVVDITTMTKDRALRERPGTMPWVPGIAASQILGQPNTFPMTTGGSNPVFGIVRRPAPDDVTTLSFMESGPDNLAATSDDYELFFYVVPEGALPPYRCIVLQFSNLDPGAIAVARVRHPLPYTPNGGYGRCPFQDQTSPQLPENDICYGTTTIEFNTDFQWNYSMVDTSGGEGDFVSDPTSPQPIITFEYQGEEVERVEMFYTKPVYTEQDIVVRITSSTGQPFPPGSALYKGFFETPECNGLFLNEPRPTGTVTDFVDLSGQIEAEGVIYMAAGADNVYCELPARVTVPGAGVYTKTLIGYQGEDLLVFTNGFEQ